MIEQRLQKINNEIQALKASMPISGSTIDLYHYTLTETKTMESGQWFYCTATFTPTNPSDNYGLVEMSTLERHMTTSEVWSQYNPMAERGRSGSWVTSGGEYKNYIEGMTATSDSAPWEAIVTVNVISTMEGTITLSWET